MPLHLACFQFSCPLLPNQDQGLTTRQTLETGIWLGTFCPLCFWLGTASGVMEFTVEVPRAVRIKSKRVFVLQAVLHVLAIVVGACPSQCCCLIVRCSSAIFIIFEKPGWAAFEPAVSQLPNLIELLTTSSVSATSCNRSADSSKFVHIRTISRTAMKSSKSEGMLSAAAFCARLCSLQSLNLRRQLACDSLSPFLGCALPGSWAIGGDNLFEVGRCTHMFLLTHVFHLVRSIQTILTAKQLSASAIQLCGLRRRTSTV